jgi:hypothetical protein
MSEEHPVFDAELEVREGNAWGRRLAAAVWALSIVAFYLGSGVLGVALSLASTVGGLVFRDGFLSTKGRARVRIDADDLTLSRIIRGRHGPRRETQTLGRRELASGHYVPSRGAGQVVLVDVHGNERLAIGVTDRAQGEELLAAFDFHVSKRRFTRNVPSPLGMTFLAAFGAAALLVVLAYPSTSPVLAVALSAAYLFVMARPQRVEIAADGVILTWFGRRRFVPFSKAKEIVAGRTGVALVLGSGKRIVVTRDSSRDAIAERLRQALDAHRRGKSNEVVASFVARDERDVAEWVRQLRTLRSEGYRTNSIDKEALLRVVEDPAAAPDARAGAVVVLRPTLDEHVRQRIRVASDATAAPALRIALDALAETDEDAEIEEHLAAVGAGHGDP